MKKIIAILAVVLATATVATAQIEVYDSVATQKTTIGKLKRGFTEQAELYYYADEGDTTYNILFNNAKYQTISDWQSISFAGGQETLDQLFAVVTTFYSDENKKNKEYKRKLKLGDMNITLSNYRIMGITSVMVWCNDGYFFMTEKEAYKLFGKI
jgi:hypothetical protein